MRPNPQTQEIKTAVLLAIGVWFASALIGGWYGVFAQQGEPPTHLGLFLALPIVGLTMAYLVSEEFRIFARGISLPLIVGAHTWRYVGVGFVIAFLMGKLPAQFGIPEGLGDIIAAIFAFPLAVALHRRRPVRRAFIIWNIFGLIDLISAITMGVLYSQGSFGILRTNVSTALMTTFPINLIPTFFVPLFILLHLLALIRYKEVAS
jgi:hypothetical protein